MRLEDITAEVRPRGRWEAVDLGFALVRRHFGRLLLAWLLCIGPIWGALLWASQWITIAGSIFLIWWWKPLYERLPLFILSRALFGATPTLKETLRAWPRLMFSNLWYSLVATRISGTRTLLLPVTTLEGLRGKARKERTKVLTRHSGGCAGSLMFVCTIYESVLALGIATLVFMFIPVEDPFHWMEAIGETGFTRRIPPSLLWMAVGCWLAALTLVELFFVGAGFGLYLNARTHLEGWDVELAFRRLGRRLAGVAAAIALLLGVGAATAQDLEISDEKKVIREEIGEVLKNEDFKIHKVETWDLKGTNKGPDLSGFGAIIEIFGYILLATGAAALVYYLVRFIMRHRHTLKGLGSAQKKIEPQAARTVAGLDVSPESLPDDIIAAARQRWLAGDGPGALSLLYRGSLSWLVHSLHLPIRDSDTEGDCLRRAAQIAELGSREYFTRLTAHWVSAAYAGHEPPSAEMEALLKGWPYQSTRSGGRSS
jgi:hypothetical protein